ncbi:MAG: hypothetical protein LKF01_03000 [Lactobacillus sp.]|jgi:hypothetical protein|nr:hypothetical protein [Lactobacillus sp.]MCH3905614.1 hypothetical protein [Lactobacillus sp.]MCH3990828.1 hypothetical protein [Lactobacillus sp.]MCH4068456.1 hypothetical protein [Lactobacillus sp.]MCI1304205.1 hypothetical protein [Lactobacillus sp.]
MTNKNLDLGLIAIFKPTGKAEPLKLARLARDYGFRGAGIITDDANLQANFEKACQTFSLTYSQDAAEPLPTEIVETVLSARMHSTNAAFYLNLDSEGNLIASDQAKLQTLNQWLHYYGHAFYEGRPSQITTKAPNLVLQNAHAPYQIYLFVKKFSAGTLSITNLPGQIKKIESLAKRTPLAFKQGDESATVNIDEPEEGLWRGLRIMLHRSEDDIEKTKY